MTSIYKLNILYNYLTNKRQFVPFALIPTKLPSTNAPIKECGLPPILIA
jgi:hypothetical protein